MKKILLYTMFGMLGLATLSSCSDDDNYPTPTPLDPSSISYEAKPGAIKLKWSIPENANYEYIRVSYTLPESGKQCLRLASVYSNTLLVENLLKRYGEIVYTLQPCSKDGKGGEKCSITAQAGAATTTVKLEATTKKYDLDETKVWCDNPETSEGTFAALFDGVTSDQNNFFHISWSNSTDFPHYIVVDLGESASAFRFSYYGRNHGNKDNPKDIDILVSNEFEDIPAYYENETGTTLVGSVSDLPSEKNASYESPSFTASTPFRYAWLKIKSSTSGSPWIALGELTFYKVKKSIYDPETGETTVLE